MSRGRYYLRRTVGSWSSGTPVTLRGEHDGDELTLSPWGHPDVLLNVAVEDIVERRRRGGAFRPPRTHQPKRRPHHVVYATPRARDASLRLMPGRVLENSVGEALSAGRTSRTVGDRLRLVFLDDDVVAVVSKRPSRLSAKDMFLILSVRREAA